MSFKINSDNDRFKEIIKGKVRKDLKNIISSENLIGQTGGKPIRIPINSIDLPHFTFNNKNSIGMGDGSPGDPIDGSGKPGKGKDKAGNEEGEHAFSVEFSPDELAQILGEELQLPNIEPKVNGKTTSENHNYSGIQRNGAEGLKHFKRTYKEAMKRSIASGEYDPKNPKILPIKDDKRYRSAVPIEKENTRNCIIYIADCSGSISNEMRHLIKSEVFWISLWLKHQYKNNIEERFLCHDVKCFEVSREEFFTISEGGGTLISSSYDYIINMIEKEYPSSDCNLYVFSFGDSENWSSEDNEYCGNLLKDKILPNVNLFCYGHLEGGGVGDYCNYLEENFKDQDKVILDKIKDETEILKSIKTFLGKGK